MKKIYMKHNFLAGVCIGCFGNSELNAVTNKNKRVLLCTPCVEKVLNWMEKMENKNLVTE